MWDTLNETEWLQTIKFHVCNRHFSIFKRNFKKMNFNELLKNAKLALKHLIFEDVHSKLIFPWVMRVTWKTMYKISIGVFPNFVNFYLNSSIKWKKNFFKHFFALFDLKKSKNWLKTPLPHQAKSAKPDDAYRKCFWNLPTSRVSNEIEKSNKLKKVNAGRCVDDQCSLPWRSLVQIAQS